MTQNLLTIHLSYTLQVLLLIVVCASFVGVLIANRVISHRKRRHEKQSRFINQMMLEALKNSENNVLQWNINEKYTTQLYGNMLPCDTIRDEDWKKHVHPDDLSEALQYSTTAGISNLTMRNHHAGVTSTIPVWQSSCQALPCPSASSQHLPTRQRFVRPNRKKGN